ncbi:MAG: hypothetical protein AB7F86_15500 [Bdellovibrionales bacterium]
MTPNQIVPLLIVALSYLPSHAEITAVPTAVPGNSPALADPEVRKACDASYAARASIASVYSNCAAAGAAKGGGVPADSMCQSMPPQKEGTLAQIWGSGIKGAGGAGCQKKGGPKPHYSQSGSRMQVKGDRVDPMPGMSTDCSGYFSGVWARLGRRIKPGQDLTSPTTTAELTPLVGSANSCIKEVTDGILPGDMIVYNENGTGHVSMIDRISAGGPGSCEFSIIESSGGTDAEYGGPRVVVKGGKGGGGVVSDRAGTTMNRLGKNCVASITKASAKVGRFDENKPGCKSKPKKFENEECISQCQEVGIKSPEVG